MAVIAKFTVQKVAKTKTGTDSSGNIKFGYEVTMYPVSSGSDEDRSFWQATPSGAISMSILNEDAGKQFEPGDTFYVSFEKA